MNFNNTQSCNSNDSTKSYAINGITKKKLMNWCENGGSEGTGRLRGAGLRAGGAQGGGRPDRVSPSDGGAAGVRARGIAAHCSPWAAQAWPITLCTGGAAGVEGAEVRGQGAPDRPPGAEARVWRSGGRPGPTAPETPRHHAISWGASRWAARTRGGQVKRPYSPPPGSGVPCSWTKAPCRPGRGR